MMFSDARPLTGWSVLAITLLAFGTVIGVNVTMAVFAVGTFPGLEVKNSYVASQVFDAEAKAQAALGWTSAATWADGRLAVDLRDRDGVPVQPADLAVLVTRPTEAREDRVVAMAFDGQGWAGRADLAPGRWRVRIAAVAADGTAFRVVRDLVVAP
jgi:nitrogen fixation protein FixH